MEVEAGSDGSLILSYDSTRFSRVLFVLAAALLAGAAYYLLADRDTERLLGFLGGAATCGLAAVVCIEQARVVVDPAGRSLTWTRRWAFRTHRGSLSFDDITAVYAERPIGDGGIPSRRVVVATRAGETIPLTAGYRTDGDRVILGASEQIRAMLGPRVAAADPAQVMVDAGRVIEAVAFLRERDGLSLTDAKQRVDALRRPR